MKPKSRPWRARAPAAKEERRQDLLAAAEHLLASDEFAQVTMAAIAARAGMAKGTAYLYFSTKEELFLELLLARVELWLGELQARLASSTAMLTPPRCAALLADSLVKRPLTVRLLVLLHPVLEHNVTVEAAVAFKRRLATLMAAPAVWLEQRLSMLHHGDGILLLLRVYALIIGLEPMAHPTAVVALALRQDPSLAAFRLDFDAQLKACVAALLRGWSPRPVH